jgi:hypothetical protein
MRSPALPWLLLLAVFIYALFARMGAEGAAEARVQARAAQDSLAKLEPVVARLRAEAERLDTVLIQTTDTIRVTVERTRVVAANATDSALAHADSATAVFIGELNAAHAEEVAALTSLADQRLLWGEGWKDVALASEAAIEQYRIQTQAQAAIIRHEKHQGTLVKALLVGENVLLGARALGVF